MADIKTIIQFAFIVFVSGTTITQVPIIPNVRNMNLNNVSLSLKIIIAIIVAHIGIVNSIENTVANGKTVIPYVQPDCHKMKEVPN